MKKLLFALIIALIDISGYSQSADKGLFKINVSTGFGILTTVSNAKVNGKGLAVPRFFGIELEYNTHKRVSLGIDFFSHTYKAKDTAVISIGGGGLGIDFKYFLTNKEKSNLFIGASIGGASLLYNAYNYPDSNSVDSVRNEVWSQAYGTYNKVYLGYNRYFGNTFGLFVKAGILNIPFRMDVVTINDIQVNRVDNVPINKWNALFRGGYVNVGLTFKFGGKKNKVPEVDSSDKKKNEPKE